MNNGGKWFNFRLDEDLQDFIQFLKKNKFNVSDYLREKLRELKKQYPEEIKQEIDRLQGMLKNIDNGNGDNIGDKRAKNAFEVLQAMAAERNYKPIGMETGAVPLIVKEIGVTEDKARDILRTLNKLEVIEVKDKQIIIKQKEGG